VTTPTGEKSPYDDAYLQWQHQQALENGYARHWGGRGQVAAGMANAFGLSGGLGGSLGGLAGQGQLAQSLEPVQHLARMNARLEDLQRTIMSLHQQLGAVNAYAQQMEEQLHAVRSQAAQQTQATRMHLDHILKHLISLAHPDKWPGNPLAHELTVALNRLREAK
jgi:Mg2+ and Co2+ transporter CorA